MCDQTQYTPDWQDTRKLVDLTNENMEVWEILNTAFHVYLQRDQKRKSVWRRSGLRGMVFQLFSKADRAFQETMADIRPDDDHFYDAIVYAAFAEFQLRNEDVNGVWPWTDVV